MTNKHNLPDEVVKALTTSRYGGDKAERSFDFSASSLVNPVQQTILKKRYPDCSEGDVVDNLWAMFGSIAHSLLEEHGTDDALTEKRLYLDVLGKTISGQCDHYKDGMISDYKVTSAYKIKKKSYQDWEIQLNIYAYLFRRHNYPVRNLQVIVIIRDWNERDTVHPDYPQAPIMIIPLTLWDEWEQHEWISSKVADLIEASDNKDCELPTCSTEDRWEDPPTYAIIKKGGKRAFRVFDTKEQLEAFNPDTDIFDIEVRNGMPRRCKRYCPVAMKCAQYQSYLKEQENVKE